MTAENIIKELPKGLIKWLDYKKNSRALCVIKDAGGSAAICEALAESGLQVYTVLLEELESDSFNKDKRYEYVVEVGALEYSSCPITVLKRLKELLNESGKLILGMDNRLAIRYFCGDRDRFTGRNFDGIENYSRIDSCSQSNLEGRVYSKEEIKSMLTKADFKAFRFYSVFPLLESPQILLAEDYTPIEELAVRIFPQYNHPETVFLEEEKLYTTLIENGLFHAMANGFLIECGNALSNVHQITVSMERGRQNAMYTIIRGDHVVEKRPVYRDGISKIQALFDNNKYLKAHGISMTEGTVTDSGDVYKMPYISGISAMTYFRELLRENQEKFITQLERLWQLILQSSEHVPCDEIYPQQKDNAGIILKQGYIDLVPLNCIVQDEEFIFYDQEIYVENLPAKVIMMRTIELIYGSVKGTDSIITKEQLLQKYGIVECQSWLHAFVGNFLNHLRNDRILAAYHNKVRGRAETISANRQKINYSINEYERLFRDIFRGTEGRKIYLFGSGNFTKLFLSQFGNDYQIEGILDNDAGRWGAALNGIPVYPPKILEQMSVDTYKVIICIKNYVSVVQQLDRMGVKNIGIFDSGVNYPRKTKRAMQCADSAVQTPKKYHIGYIAGVFDLFHVGHLNMFKRAKAQCDYLIVGVVSDESVMKDKKTTPFVPFDERIEMVRSCRYVDEAVEIPAQYNNTDEAYRRYQFDVQFSGSDYEKNPVWLAKQAFLQQQGADMVFFSYTESTSSTKLKRLIDKKLI